MNEVGESPRQNSNILAKSSPFCHPKCPNRLSTWKGTNGCGSNPCTPEHQHRWQMDIHKWSHRCPMARWLWASFRRPGLKRCVPGRACAARRTPPAGLVVGFPRANWSPKVARPRAPKKRSIAPVLAGRMPKMVELLRHICALGVM